MSKCDREDLCMWDATCELYGDCIDTELPLEYLLANPTELERMLRESYQPILSEEDYDKLRKKCGLGKLIEGEVTGDWQSHLWTDYLAITANTNSKTEKPPTK